MLLGLSAIFILLSKNLAVFTAIFRFGIVRNAKNRLRITSKTVFSGRGGQIRTDDLLLPKQTRYRATLHPENLRIENYLN